MPPPLAVVEHRKTGAVSRYRAVRHRQSAAVEDAAAFVREPPVMVRPEMAAFVTNGFTVKTGPPPLTVTRFVRVAPLPVVGPVMVVWGGML